MGVVFADIPWAVVLILLPLAGGMIGFLWPEKSKRVGLATACAVTLSVAGLGCQILTHGVYHHAVGGWGAPLGIDLYADGLSLLMLAATALVGLGVSVYSAGYFQREDSFRFWPLWLFLLAALNALFLSADIFNLYVTLELVGLAAVAMTALPGGRDALSGAMRYLLTTLLGSLAYLFGVALLYHGFDSVDISILAVRVEASPVVWASLGLMGAGLLLKTALFPLHFWLPPAHASAPAPVSALLSALVGVVGAFSGTKRRWLWLALWLPALALAGAPLTSGMAAKVLLKAQTVNAPEPWISLLPALLPWSAAATALLLGRFLVLLYLPKPKASNHSSPTGLIWPWALLVTAGIVLPWWFVPKSPALWSRTAVLSSLWPSLLGAVLTLVAGLWRARLNRKSGAMPLVDGQVPTGVLLPSIPPGDLLVPISRGLNPILTHAGRLADEQLPHWRDVWLTLLRRLRTQMNMWKIIGRIKSRLNYWPAALVILVLLGLAMAGLGALIHCTVQVSN